MTGKRKLGWAAVAVSMALGVAVFVLWSRCGGGQRGGDAVPAEPNYAEASQWYKVNRAGAADIFYVISTETGDYALSDGTQRHYADTYADSLRAPMTAEMEGVETLLAGTLNFYAPYYRQCSLETFASDSLMLARMPLATDDVRRAFAHYLAHDNGGRPFVLVGFSQGAMIALELLRDMAPDVRARLVAAYIIGASIPQRLLDECPPLVPARRADDTGTIISYNSVRDASCAMWPRSAVCINPVNWRIDGEPAHLDTEPSPFVPVEQQQKQHLTVTLDTVSNLLFVEGYASPDYVIPLIGKEGNYHSREIWLYREQLRANMQLRTERWLQK